VNVLLEILTQFGGGGAEPVQGAVRYLLPGFFWGGLALVAFVHWRAVRERRDRLVGIAALVGLSRELFLFVAVYGSSRGWIPVLPLLRLTPPLEHAATLLSSALICYAFIRCLLRWPPMPRAPMALLLAGMGLIFAGVLYAWARQMQATPASPFVAFTGHLVLHVAGTFLLAALLASALSEIFWGRRRVPVVLLIAMLFLLTDEGIPVAAAMARDDHHALLVPIQYNLHLWAIPLFIAVYWQELRVRMEEAEKTRSGFFELSPGLLCVAAMDGTIRFANPASLRILGVSPAALAGRSLSEFCRPPDPDAFDLSMLRETSDAVHVEAPHAFPGEKAERWLHWTLRVEPRGSRIFAMATDATAQKRAHDSLLRSEEMLRHSTKMEAIGRLAGGIAHDFNNLLTAILGYCELIDAHSADAGRVRKDAGEIRKAAERAAALTRQLLAFSRRQQMRPRAMDLNETLLSMSGIMQRLIGEDIALVARPGAGLAKVKADPGQVEQVIVNLVVNARDAMPQGGQIILSTRNGDAKDAVVLEVRDTGCGMDAETQARIFEPFFTTKEVGKGTGLGLSTVYGIVQQSGGGIRVSSTPGAGTTFTVSFPMAGDEIIEGAAPPPDDPVPIPTRERILLVEDEDAVRDMVRQSLQMHGYVVREASDGRSALAIYEMNRGAFDMVLTDVVMPGMSGGELAAALRVIDPAVRVLFMSGYSDDALVSRGVSGSGMAFIEKPFTQEALSNKVREVLGTKAPAAAS
jgi:PAS domain S-box-containing protein